MNIPKLLLLLSTLSIGNLECSTKLNYTYHINVSNHVSKETIAEDSISQKDSTVMEYPEQANLYKIISEEIDKEAEKLGPFGCIYNDKRERLDNLLDSYAVLDLTERKLYRFELDSCIGWEYVITGNKPGSNPSKTLWGVYVLEQITPDKAWIPSYAIVNEIKEKHNGVMPWYFKKNNNNRWYVPGGHPRNPLGSYAAKLGYLSDSFIPVYQYIFADTQLPPVKTEDDDPYILMHTPHKKYEEDYPRYFTNEWNISHGCIRVPKWVLEEWYNDPRSRGMILFVGYF